MLKTAAELAVLQGSTDEAKILKEAKSSLIETGYDNWNGGITYFTLALEVPLKIFSKIEKSREGFERAIKDRMNSITRTDAANAISEVIITPVLLSDDENEGETEKSLDTIVPSFWEPNYFRLFISHSSIVKEGAHAIKEALAHYQVAAFVAHDDIEPSFEWQNEIENALRTMDALVAIITPEFSTSKWCDQEVGYALGRGKFVIPLTTDSSPYGFLAKIQGMKIKGLKATEVAKKISEALIQNPATRPRMTETLVESLVNSGSWETSRIIMGHLEKVPDLSSSQIARLLTAADENSQVKNAFMGSSTVPEKIRALAKRVSP